MLEKFNIYLNDGKSVQNSSMKPLLNQEKVNIKKAHKVTCKIL